MVKQLLHMEHVIGSIPIITTKQRPYSSVVERSLGMTDADGSIPSWGTKLKHQFFDKYKYA